MGEHNKLEKFDPRKANRILARLAAGASYRSIMRDENVHYNTIVRLREDNPQKYESWRKTAAAKAQQAAEMAVDRIVGRLSDEDAMGKVSFKDLGIVYGIAADKSQVLNGEASSIVETKQGIDVDQARKAIEAAQKQIQGEAIDV